MPSAFFLAPLLLAAFAIHRFFPKRSPLAHIPGPPSSSFIYGNLTQLLLPHTYGTFEFSWQTTFGGLYRIKGPFSSDRLVISDPAALKAVMSDTQTWKRSDQQQYSVDMLIGKKAVFYIEGEEHKRVRNVMNAAFAPVVIRGLPPVFKGIAEKIANRWEDMLVSGAKLDASGAMDIYPSLHDATLDAVGEGAMGYEFHSLENSDSELGASHRNIIALSGVRSPFHILVDAIVPYISPTLLSLALKLPTPAFKVLQKNKELSKAVSSELIASQQEIVRIGAEGRRDVTYALVKANASSKSGHQMSDEEMAQQIPSLMIAGQDTTGNTLSWAIYRLASSPELQEKIRAEVIEACESSPGGDISLNTIEGMVWLNAFLKETLRLHPGLPMSDRIASTDAVIPVSQPITTSTGEKITEVRVPKGTHVHVATASANRLEYVWGPDAHEFKPERWIEPSKWAGNRSASNFGPYANLSTFFGGARVCIGWRFAVTELQILFTELVRRFRFALPPPETSPELQVRMSVAVNMIPVIKSGKPSLPVIVEAI
ncbi:cytochrome P450 [Pleurotus eryngii]|uniref:Cytochrome P450 n=1 Tax=Pleurotus eryngii TaxID=5323 RepID=A0A9P6DG13_PLEER|nr:cytochrome P450 [Pleurotus eryngii]